MLNVNRLGSISNRLGSACGVLEARMWAFGEYTQGNGRNFDDTGTFITDDGTVFITSDGTEFEYAQE